jgi:hypothetical protein
VKTFFITTPEHAQELKHEWHGIDLQNGKLMICLRFRDEGHEMEWTSHPDVIRLPHPIFESNIPLTGEHHGNLWQRFALVPGDGIHDVIKQAAKVDPFMRLHVL